MADQLQADIQNMTAEEVTNALLAQQIRAHHFRGADNALLVDMLIKINQHFQNLKRDLEVIRDEIRTVIVANEPHGNDDEIAGIEFEDMEADIAIGADSPRSIDSSSESDISRLICDSDLDSDDSQPDIIEVTDDSSEDESIAQLAAKYRTLKEN